MNRLDSSIHSRRKLDSRDTQSEHGPDRRPLAPRHASGSTGAFVGARLRIVIPALTIGMIFSPSLTAAAGQPLCPSSEERPQVLIETGLGVIALELFENAAPQSLKQLAALIQQGQVFSGATFGYTRPHQEIRLVARVRPASEVGSITTQLDATALGLENDRIRSAGEAMKLLQHELLTAFADRGKRTEPKSLLASWLDTWYQTRDPSFLVGTSRRTVNEALGHRYQEGLDSRPPVRGTVALEPASANRSTPNLSVLLSDMPHRTGRWMVIGKVTRGLELAQAISLRPRSPGPRGYKGFEPAEPVIVTSVRFDCQASDP